MIEWVHEIVAEEGGEVLELRVTPTRDLLLTLDRDEEPVDTVLLMRVIKALRRRIFDMDEDPGEYRIEVDTPGDRRLLITARHFERFAGESVRLYYEDGQRERVTLLGPDGESARVRDEGGEERSIDPSSVEAIRLSP